MKIGIPKEIINNENRVALTPPFVKTLVDKNHEVVVETMAGFGSGFTDEEYVENGASIVTYESPCVSSFRIAMTER